MNANLLPHRNWIRFETLRPCGSIPVSSLFVHVAFVVITTRYDEDITSPNMSFFKGEGFGFYVQDAYVKDWIDNTMVFLEVDNVERRWTEMGSLDLPARNENVRISPIRLEHWGKEYFVHDPSGMLWHFGEFVR